MRQFAQVGFALSDRSQPSNSYLLVENKTCFLLCEANLLPKAQIV